MPPVDQLTKGDVRLRIARGFSQDKCSRRRRSSLIQLIIWYVVVVVGLTLGRRIPSKWDLIRWALASVVLTTWTVEDWRSQPRGPDAITDSEVEEAIQGARRCPRCGEGVLRSELRCPFCKSIWHNLVIGIDVWMPLLMLGAFIGALVVAAVVAR